MHLGPRGQAPTPAPPAPPPPPRQQATWLSPTLQALLGLPPAPSWWLCQAGRVLCPIFTC